MSRGKLASLHSGMLMRAQIGNGGFFADAAGATPNVASLAAQAAAPAPGHVRQPRTSSGSVFSHQNLSPAPSRRADILPPGSIAVADQPRVRKPEPMPQPERGGAQQLIAEAHERVRRWDREDRQADEEYEDYLPEDPWQSSGQQEADTPETTQDRQPPQPEDTGPFRIAERTQPGELPVRKRRKAMTLRLPPNQHKALKLASVRLDRTCQDIMSTALTSYLAEMVGINDIDE